MVAILEHPRIARKVRAQGALRHLHPKTPHYQGWLLDAVAEEKQLEVQPYDDDAEPATGTTAAAPAAAIAAPAAAGTAAASAATATATTVATATATAAAASIAAAMASNARYDDGGWAPAANAPPAAAGPDEDMETDVDMDLDQAIGHLNVPALGSPLPADFDLDSLKWPSPQR
jgi:hypothetical protein